MELGAADTFTSLMKDNKEYDKLLEFYNKKSKTATMFFSKEEFIEAEIERVKTIFTKPIEIKIGGDFKKGAGFNFTDFTKSTYDSLVMGFDSAIEPVIDNARKQYKALFPGNFEEEMFYNSMMISLNRGVAWLMYEVFLRKELKTIKNNPAIMAKNFETEIRNTFEKPYLKVFLKAGLDFETASVFLESLPSVRRANVTIQKGDKKDLTVYPEKAYGIEELEQEVRLALTNFFEGRPLDPSFKPNALSTVSDKAYFEILDHMLRLGKDMENLKALYEKLDEERYRDYFIPFLNAISKQHSTKAEVFNRKGKTDILVFDIEGNNIFIAECKLWKGESYLNDAIDQLLQNYVNWRDEKVALIIFNKQVQKFSDIITKAIHTVQSHPQCVKALGQRNQTSYSFLFKSSLDDSKIIKFELVLFNFT